MPEFEAARSLPATSEIVLGTAGDPRLLDRWIPSRLHARPAGDGTVHVREEGGPVDADVPFEVDPERMLVRWGGSDPDDYHGELRVVEGNAGASRATLRLSFPHGTPSVPAEEVGPALSRSLDALADLVSLRLQDSG